MVPASINVLQAIINRMDNVLLALLLVRNVNLVLNALAAYKDHYCKDLPAK
jgi:hypothetical protein